MKDKKSLQQLQLLKELLQGKELKLEEFARKFDISKRTAQRYMQDIKEVFEDNIIKQEQSYTFVSSLLIEKNLLAYDKNALSKIVDLFCLIEFDLTKILDETNSSLVKKLQKNYAQCYSIKQNAFENFMQHKELEAIKKAIKHKRYANITYESDKTYFFQEEKLLKIIFYEGNFYVATLCSDESINNGFKFLRLGFIKEVKLLSKTFHKDIQAEFFTQEFQTLFTQYNTPTYKVVVEVSKEVERFFKQKKFLKSQKTVQQNPFLQLEFEVTNDMEILPLVKKWLPHLKIISPQDTKMKLQEELEGYLNL
jgi:predicted DNA-binding transcriptional regulator YafY